MLKVLRMPEDLNMLADAKVSPGRHYSDAKMLSRARRLADEGLLVEKPDFHFSLSTTGSSELSSFC